MVGFDRGGYARYPCMKGNERAFGEILTPRFVPLQKLGDSNQTKSCFYHDRKESEILSGRRPLQSSPPRLREDKSWENLQAVKDRIQKLGGHLRKDMYVCMYACCMYVYRLYARLILQLNFLTHCKPRCKLEGKPRQCAIMHNDMHNSDYISHFKDSRGLAALLVRA